MKYKSKVMAGFALPTVMIASVVMMMVLLSGLVASSSVNVALRDQYDNKVLSQAVEAGKAFATACLKQNDGTANWAMLYPNSDCASTAATNLCPDTGAPATCFLVDDANNKSTFTVGPLTTDADGNRTLTINGYLRKLRTSDGSTLKQSSLTKIMVVGNRSSVLVTYGMGLGGSTSCGLTSDSKAYCWGAGANGRLGNGGTANSSVPVAVSQGAIPAGVTLRSLATGMTSTCAIGSDGKAYCWGYNVYGQLGDGTTAQSLVPVAVSQGSIPSNVSLTSITVGQYHACATGSDGKAYCWGFNNAGQLGNNSSTNSSVPVAVEQGSVSYRAVVAKLYSTCAVASTGQAYCWGQNSSMGMLGNGTTLGFTVPTAVAQGAIPAGVSVKMISSGGSGYHTCIVGTDDKLYCWGSNSYGQLGTGNATNALSPVAVSQGAIPAGTKFESIETGYVSTCAVSSVNKVYCWGHGTVGTLGNGANTTSYTPVAVSQGAIPAGIDIKSLSLGQYQVCSTAMNNMAYCWGQGTSGQLGNNSLVNATTPAAVNSALNWQQNTYRVDNPVLY